MATQQGYWTEGKVVNGTNVGGGVFVPGPKPSTNPTPAVATPAPTTSTPTITVPNRNPSLLESARIEAESAAASRANARAQADSYAAQMRQARIDAINQAYAPRIQREKQEGDERLSRVAALNLRSGVVGSGFDTTRTGEQKGLNEKALQALEAEKAQAINEAFGWADELSRQRASEIYEDTKDAANAKVTRYKEQAETALGALDIFGAQNITAEQLKSVDPKTYETLRDVSGMSDTQIDAYLKAKAPEGTYQWNAAEISGSTMYVPKVVNGKLTMDKLELGYTPKDEGKEYKTTVKTDDGVLIIYGDGTYDLIGSSSGVKLQDGAPSWEQYLEAAQNAAKMTFTNETREELRAQYDKEYILKDLSDFTSSEKKRLEQAELLNASRKEQLDFLYGEDQGGIDFSTI
jgi:hypothetical protein